MDWILTKAHLDRLIFLHMSFPDDYGFFVQVASLIALRDRYNVDERSDELYRAIWDFNAEDDG